MKKTSQFRQLLTSSELEFILEAHNGISARIAAEAGFKGIWGSGLSISAQYGVRDNNEASWTQVLEMLEFMADAAPIPIMLDGDTGYGNFNNMRRLIAKLEQRDIAAVCIEDKLFPKTNSFINGDAQPLADIDEFCGKIKAGKDAQRDDDFSIVARVEAFIAGWGLGEALRRAEAYHAAGADAILMHSALKQPDEILAFTQEWANRCPVVIVPTKYYATPTPVFRQHKVSMIIWANHLLRSAVKAMQHTAAQIKQDENLFSVEDKVASVAEIFRLQGADELQAAEQRYLPKGGLNACAVILAAARGKELGELTESRPKAMIDIAGKPLLAHITDAYKSTAIKDVYVVRGYRKETVNLPGLSYVDNNDYADTGELYSLQQALAGMDDSQDLVISYGDVIFNRYILSLLLEKQEDFVVAVDTDWRQSANRLRQADYVQCNLPHSRTAFRQQIQLINIADAIPETQTHGEWMGFLKVSAAGRGLLRQLLAQCLEDPANRQAKMPLLINQLVTHLQRHDQAVHVVYTSGHWLDIDSVDDVVTAAGSF